MAKFGGFGGGNMQQLMRQAQKMQQEMMEAQEELKTIEVTGASATLHPGWAHIALPIHKSCQAPM